jgi:hypothetical protein
VEGGEKEKGKRRKTVRLEEKLREQLEKQAGSSKGNKQ